MSKYVFVFLLVLFFHGVQSQNSTKCLSQQFPVDLDGTMCLGITWYLYAASDPCENCCLKRTVTTTKKDSLVATNIFKRASDTNPTTTIYTGIRVRSKTSYATENDTVVLLSGTNCKNTAVTYSTSYDKLRVFSSDPNVNPSFLSTLEGVKKCDMKIHKYNPAVACKGL